MIRPIAVVLPEYSIRREGDEESVDLDRDGAGVRGVREGKHLGELLEVVAVSASRQARTCECRQLTETVGFRPPEGTHDDAIRL
jgi:hypothetical protein